MGQGEGSKSKRNNGSKDRQTTSKWLQDKKKTSPVSSCSAANAAKSHLTVVGPHKGARGQPHGPRWL